MRAKTIELFIYIFIIRASLNGSNTKNTRIKLTKIKCNATDNLYFKFETCHIKAESRDLQYFVIYIKLFQVPITDINARFRFLKRANGYKPFLYDFTMNCDFLKHMDPLKKIIWGWFKDVSNLNHSCPLTEDFEIRRLENRYLEMQLSALPIISGDYAFFVEIFAYNVTRFNAEFIHSQTFLCE